MTTQTGERDAAEFLRLVELHRDEFYRYILRTLWNPAGADDVFQSAVLAAYENYHRFTPGTNFRAWMYRIITNKCFVANRETGRGMTPIDSAEAGMVSLKTEPAYGDVLKDPARFLELCGDEVQRSFHRLSTAERSCILLRSVERFSYQEIAEILEMPVGTVMTHLSRGRAKLRKELLEYAKGQGIVRTFPRLIPHSEPDQDQAQRETI